MRSLPGVKYATSQAWFGGIYQDDKNQLSALAVDVPTFFLVYNDYTLPPDQKKAFEQDRTGAIVGSAVAERFGWKIGDTVPIRSNIWTKKDGGNVWPMKIAGIYTAKHRRQPEHLLPPGVPGRVAHRSARTRST